MRPEGAFVLLAGAVIGIGIPLLAALAAFMGGRDGRSAPVGWRLSVASGLAAALSFNLVFIVQEIVLVLVKALTSGLRPTLFHNNHTWTGDNPIANLEQGAGALAILVIGCLALAWLSLRPPRTAGARLLLLWTAFNGLYQSLMQGVIGAAVPQNDVGMAMDYLGLGRPERLAAAGLALVAMAAGAMTLGRRALGLAGVAGPGRTTRAGVLFRAVTLPGLAAIVLILPFRSPGPLDQVVLVPVIVMLLGLSMVQASAWRAAPAAGQSPAQPRLTGFVVALLVTLAVFQLVLRPGIPV